MGSMLTVLAILWLGSLLLYRLGVGGVLLPSLPLPGLAPTAPPRAHVSPLAAAGISLRRPTRAPALTQQQALFMAGQLEPDAATQAKETSAQYVLLNYAGTSTTTLPASLNNIPTWMIVYQHIPLAPADPTVDPTPFPQSQHDLYVFLDANSGKELLAIWV